MRLSILIPSLSERSEKLMQLKAQLHGQLELEKLKDQVEVLILLDEGQKSIGKKRQELIEMAQGEYICFIDDDDKVHVRYIYLVMEALKTSPDVVGMRLTHYMDYNFFGDTIHSLAYKQWTNVDNGNGTWSFYRNPNHLNPVKRELALKAGFPNKSNGEDKDYSMKLLPYLKTQVMIETPIYYYMDRSKK